MARVVSPWRSIREINRSPRTVPTVSFASLIDASAAFFSINAPATRVYFSPLRYRSVSVGAFLWFGSAFEDLHSAAGWTASRRALVPVTRRSELLSIRDPIAPISLNDISDSAPRVSRTRPRQDKASPAGTRETFSARIFLFCDSSVSHFHFHHGDGEAEGTERVKRGAEEGVSKLSTGSSPDDRLR